MGASRSQSSSPDRIGIKEGCMLSQWGKAQALVLDCADLILGSVISDEKP